MQEPSPPPLAPPAPAPVPQRGFNLHNMETLEAALQEAMQVGLHPSDFSILRIFHGSMSNLTQGSTCCC